MQVVEPQKCANCHKATARDAVFCHLCGCRQDITAPNLAVTFSKLFVSAFLALLSVCSALLGTCFLSCRGGGGQGSAQLTLVALCCYLFSIGMLTMITRVMKSR